MQKRIIVLGGPTASGKSKIALNLAKETHSVIINADSMQVYREIPLLGAQPSEAERAVAPHKLYSILSVAEEYSVGRFLDDAAREIESAWEAGLTPILVGGTGLYLRCLIHGMAEVPDVPTSLRNAIQAEFDRVGREAFHATLHELDPIAAEKLNTGDTQRLIRARCVVEATGTPLHVWQEQHHKRLFDPALFTGFFIHPPRDVLYERCNARFEAMIAAGALEEARALMDAEISPTASKALGLLALMQHLTGEITLEEAIASAQQDTRNYAKRQMTFFRNQFPEFKQITSEDATDAVLRSL